MKRHVASGCTATGNQHHLQGKTGQGQRNVWTRRRCWDEGATCKMAYIVHRTGTDVEPGGENGNKMDVGFRLHSFG
jgi:hypothetical protein